MKRAFPILMGLIGVTVLCGLGVWQLQRLSWKSAILADIDARITAAPVAVPLTPDPEQDRYLPVAISGQFVGNPVRVITSTSEAGPGYRLISAFAAEDGRRIMVDVGFVRQADADAARPAGTATVTGNLHWPEEVDRWTPPRDSTGLFYARDVDDLAAALGADPLLVIARTIEDAETGTQVMPVDTAAVSNDHLNYAITWFALAVVWAAMSVYLVLRNRKDA